MSAVTETAQEVVAVANQVNPTAPIVEALTAAVNTVINPSVAVIVDDLVLVHNLVTTVKAQLAGKPVTLASIFQLLFNAN